jgi:hypothetical protein
MINYFLLYSVEATIEEGGAVVTPLLQATIAKDNK